MSILASALDGPHKGEPNAYGPTYWYRGADGYIVIEERAGSVWCVAAYLEGLRHKQFVLFSRTGPRLVRKSGSYFQSVSAAEKAISSLVASTEGR